MEITLADAIESAVVRYGVEISGADLHWNATQNVAIKLAEAHTAKLQPWWRSLPDAERWARFERLGQLLESHPFQFAKTMPQNPHWYTLRKKWAHDDEFQWAVETIRLAGRRQRYAKTWYVVCDVNEFFYWSMGWPVNYSSGHPCTILINRKPLQSEAGRDEPPYDKLADWYDSAFHDTDSEMENAHVFGLIGDLADKDVLDVGCGTGLAVPYCELSNSYVGIDPSRGMLDKLLDHFPMTDVIQTQLKHYVPLDEHKNIRRFDVVLGLFGVGSYLTDDELQRIPLLLREGGRAVIMFYAEDYTPKTYQETGVMIPHRKWAPGLFPGKVHRINNFVMALYDKVE